MRFYSPYVAALCLGLMGPLAGAALSQAPPPPSNEVEFPPAPAPKKIMSRPRKVPDPPALQVTVTGPQECFVDQPVTFQVEVRNIGTKPLGKRSMEVSLVGNHNSIRTRTVMVRNGNGTMTSVVEQSVVQGTVFTESSVVGERLLAVKALGVNESQTFPVKLTFKHHGEGDLFVAVPGAGLAERPNVPPPVEPDDVPQIAQHLSPVTGQPWHIKVAFDPRTPLGDLLPTAPKTVAAPVRLPGSLSEVPEVLFQQNLPKPARADASMVHTLRTIGKINLVNQRKADAFMDVLLAQRLDLAGLPFVMGDACRLSEERGRQFGTALSCVHRARLGGVDELAPQEMPVPPPRKRMPAMPRLMPPKNADGS